MGDFDRGLLIYASMEVIHFQIFPAHDIVRGRFAIVDPSARLAIHAVETRRNLPALSVRMRADVRLVRTRLQRVIGSAV